jgi:23S rRNA pseudouridine1911/1915/1917 synthase
MDYVGHPVVCDSNYGLRKEIYRSDLVGAEHYPSEKPLLSRQALHARRITLWHSGLEKEMTFEAPLPPDMMGLVEALRELADKKGDAIN